MAIENRNRFTYTLCVDWCPLTEEHVLAPGADAFTVYIVSKTLAEQKLWNFANEHPEIDITTSEQY